MPPRLFEGGRPSGPVSAPLSLVRDLSPQDRYENPVRREFSAPPLEVLKAGWDTFSIAEEYPDAVPGSGLLKAERTHRLDTPSAGEVGRVERQQLTNSVDQQESRQPGIMGMLA